MDRLDAAGLSWKLYTAQPGPENLTGYGWAICPSFAECLDGPQKQRMVPNTDVLTDAAHGTLPSFSVVTPDQGNSQHNSDSMAVGDNWVGQVVSALEHGPEWSSTAVFLSWDDCGCFYDHVPPPGALGIRVPMIIASPYARAGFTDSTVASYNSVLAFTEAAYGLPNLTGNDAAAYNYMRAFNFTQAPQAGVGMTTTTVSPAELDHIRKHPPDAQDPT
jgi:phospholipase C